VGSNWKATQLLHGQGTSFNGQKQQRIDLNADALYNDKAGKSQTDQASVFMAMMSDHNSSDLAPQRQMAFAENNTSGPVPQCLNDVCSHQFRPRSSSNDF
ncbi:hypothetical protein Tco_0120599, partial [Tanacetum coccineum]